MATTSVNNQAAVLAAMRRVPAAVEQEVRQELDVCAQLIARTMRRLSQKRATAAAANAFTSQLLNSVTVHTTAPLEREISPTADYAVFVERGVKSGGKGLPKFSDPEAADIVGWLRRAAFRGQPRVRRNSMAAVQRNLELRDRYQGLAWHIRRKGVRANPFIARSLEEMAPEIERRMALAVRRGMAAGGAPA